MFTSERHLGSSLKELVEEDKIVRKQYSHKNVVYMLSEDFETIVNITRLERIKIEKQKEAIEEILISKGNLTILDTKAWITTHLLNCSGLFLFALERWVRTPKKYQQYVKNELMGSMLDNFGILLSTFGQTYPTETDSSLRIVKLMIWELMNHPALKDQILGNVGFIDFDIQKAKEEKRIISTRKSRYKNKETSFNILH